MNKLSDLRQEIDSIDEKLLYLFEKRMSLVEKVAEYKRENACAVEDAAREQEIIANRISQVSDKENRDYAEKFFTELMHISKQRQKALYNLYLIGMPYSGKTRLAKELEKRSNRQATDTDMLIEESANMSIERIFQTEGEGAFRKVETTVLRMVAAQGGLIVSTGGGIIKAEQNIALLKNSGYCVLLDMPLDKLLCAYNEDKEHNRPLIKDAEDIEVLYFERFKAYRSIADLIVNPCDENAVDKILDFMKSCTDLVQMR